jgi:hypothetical protein
LHGSRTPFGLYDIKLSVADLKDALCDTTDLIDRRGRKCALGYPPKSQGVQIEESGAGTGVKADYSLRTPAAHQGIEPVDYDVSQSMAAADFYESLFEDPRIAIRAARTGVEDQNLRVE